MTAGGIAPATSNAGLNVPETSEATAIKTKTQIAAPIANGNRLLVI
jgi:hypothetical protein